MEPTATPPDNQQPLNVVQPAQDIPRRKRLPRAVIAAIAVVIVIAAGMLLYGGLHSSSPMVDNEEHKYEATVTFDDSGFLPATLTVRPDTEIFFENHAKNAENGPGATVRVLQSKAAKDQADGFSSGQIAPASGYGYVFRHKGTFHFYNADNVQQTVTVIVGS